MRLQFASKKAQERTGNHANLKKSFNGASDVDP